jgi:hypothetical protein
VIFSASYSTEYWKQVVDASTKNETLAREDRKPTQYSNKKTRQNCGQRKECSGTT